MLKAAVTWFMSWVTPLNVAFYAILTALTYLALLKLNAKIVGTPELNEKYWPFCRKDLQQWGFWRFFLRSFFTFGIVRFWLTWVCVAVHLCFALLFMVGHTTGERLAPWRAKCLHYLIKGPSRMFLFFAGAISCESNHVSVNYRHYLGPEWTENAKEPVGI